jgi:hypothetical protein
VIQSLLILSATVYSAALELRELNKFFGIIKPVAYVLSKGCKDVTRIEN